MSTITTRSGKGSPLTNNEVDANFTNLNTDKLESGDLSVVTTAVGTAALAYNSGVFTYTPPDLTDIDLSLYAPLAGATFTGDVEAPEFVGSLRGNNIFKAKAGEALTKGDAVYISGISGNTPVVNLADADVAGEMPAFGVASVDASLNSTVDVVTYGAISGLDTSGFALGDTLYVGTTPGELVNTAPSGESSLIQNIGKVERVHASAGILFIAGAGRTNATPNLNDGNFFLGNSSNQSVSADFTTAVLGEISAGTGISLSATGVIANTAPDQTVALTGGTGISTSGTYPSFTITNDSPDQTVALTGAGATSISGTYPNFTITSANTTYSVGDGGLTEINFTSADHAKLNGIATGANNYSLPLATNTVRGGIELFSNTDQSVAANGITTTANRTYGIQLNSANQAVVNVPWSDTNTVYSLPLSSSSTRGGVKIGYSENGKNYPVELSSEKMYVNVPWTDSNTTYSAGTGISLSGTTFSLTDTNAKLNLTGGTLTGALKLEGGSYSSGIDTATVALAVDKGDYIYSDDGNYLRRIIGHTTSGAIEIGQNGTSLVNNINLLTGASGNSAAKVNGNTIWNAANDGSGSGLDADLLDGQHGSYYYSSANPPPLTADPTLTLTGDVTGSATFTNLGNATLTTVVNNDSHYHSQVYIPDTRGAQRAPSYYPDKYVSFDFQNNADTLAGGDSWNVLQTVAPWSVYDASHRQQQLAWTGTGGLKFRYATSESAWAGWQTLWTSGNDGSGSGLDADLLDGQHGSYYYSSANPPPTYSKYLRSDADDTATGVISFTNRVNIGNSVTRPDSLNSDSVAHARIGGSDVHLYVASLGSVGGYKVAVQAARASDFASFDLNLQSNGGGLQRGGNLVWDSGTDGSGSGLDADTVDGIQASSFVRSDAADVKTGDLNLRANLNMKDDNTTAARYVHLPRGGGVTFYGDGSTNHSITSRNSASSVTDDLFISSYGAVYIALDRNNNNGSAADFAITTNGSTTQRLTFSGENYNLTVSGNVTAYSDVRLKENIQVIPNALSKVEALRGVTFTRNDQEDTDRRHVGVIAQEVEAVLPEAVWEGEDGMKNVAYGNMVGLLIESIKELKAEVDDLKIQLENK